MKKIGHIVACSTCLALGLASALSARAQTISMASPFLPRNGGAIGSGPENSPVELRGILKDEGASVFGLYDPIKKQGGWIKLNETGKDFPATVRSYDAANESVTVEYQGRVLNLSLKTAKIESMPIVAQNLAARPGLPNQVPPAINGAPAVTDNARQMEAVAAEVQRRRLQRQAALQRGGPNTTAPGQAPAVVSPTNQATPTTPPQGNGIGRGAGGQ